MRDDAKRYCYNNPWWEWDVLAEVGGEVGWHHALCALCVDRVHLGGSVLVISYPALFFISRLFHWAMKCSRPFPPLALQYMFVPMEIAPIAVVDARLFRAIGP